MASLASLTESEIEELCDIRRGLECLAAETAVLRVSTSDMARFRWSVLDICGPSATFEQYEARDRELHRILVRASGNQRLLEMYEYLVVLLAPMNALRQMDWAGSMSEESREHHEMLNALQVRDADRLKVVLRRHIERAKAQMLLALHSPAT